MKISYNKDKNQEYHLIVYLKTENDKESKYNQFISEIYYNIYFLIKKNILF